MTSSLVGSEMCIRDREEHCPQWQQAAPPALSTCLQGVAGEAVSQELLHGNQASSCLGRASLPSGWACELLSGQRGPVGLWLEAGAGNPLALVRAAWWWAPLLPA
eukprot:3134329-Prorocentrum_lima.AAC.1